MKPIIALRLFELCQGYEWKVWMDLSHSNHNPVFAYWGLSSWGWGCLAPLPGALCIFGSSVAAQWGDKKNQECRSPCWFYMQVFKNVYISIYKTTSWSGVPQLGEQAEQNHLQMVSVHGQTYHRKKKIPKKYKLVQSFMAGWYFFAFFLHWKGQFGLSHNINVAQQDKLDWWA